MADLDFVNSLYLNVLARDPDTAGATYWLGRISGGTTYDEVRDAFLNSAEAQTFVNPLVRLYEGLFNRAPDAAGLKYWADALRGGTTLNSITDAFLHSSEAQANGFGDGLSNTDFVNKLYLGMGRSQAQIDADTDGFSYWLNALNSSNRSPARPSRKRSWNRPRTCNIRAALSPVGQRCAPPVIPNLPRPRLTLSWLTRISSGDCT